MTSAGGATFGYNAKNQLVAKDGVTQLYYDPLGRLTQQWNGGGVLDWDGLELIAELGGSPLGVTRRYVHGPGIDEPIVWYEGAGTADRRFLMADERGSIVSVTNASGGVIATNTYDEYGRPGSGNVGRFQYTGQAYIPELDLYYYKARMYNPEIGRFMQVDPIGYEDQVNLYAYVGGDPVNGRDPSGLSGCSDMADQGLTGACLESADFDEDKDGTNTTVSNVNIDEAAVATSGLLKSKDGEKGTTLDQGSDGKITHGKIVGGKENHSGQETTIVPKDNTVSIIHSHPESDDFEIAPGYESKDKGDHSSVENGQPNYITRSGVVIVLEKSGGQYRVRLILGKLNSTDRRHIKSRLRSMQRATR